MEGHVVHALAERADEDRPSLDSPCPHCGLTGEAMVDWCGYAGRLRALVAEMLAGLGGPPEHLEDELERLDLTPPAGEAA